MATIRNRNGRWHVQVRRSGSKSVNGTFTLKSDAQLWAREQERAIELDGFDKPNKAVWPLLTVLLFQLDKMVNLWHH